jgi:hypothetical protein
LPIFSPPPTPQLNLGGKDDHHGVIFMRRNPQQPMRLHMIGLAAMTRRTGMTGMTNGADKLPIRRTIGVFRENHGKSSGECV